MPALQYQLPGAPEVFVDVRDDEDVALMLEEWREAVTQGTPGLRLHIFVQVCAGWGLLRAQGARYEGQQLNAGAAEYYCIFD